MPGRRRKPTRLKLLTGNPGKRPLPENEPIPPEGEVIRPAWLKYRAAELWDEWEPILVAMGTLTVADTPPFARWCVDMARFEEMNGLVPDSFKAGLRHLEAILGIGAASRARLGTGKRKPTDPADEFFKKTN